MDANPPDTTPQRSSRLLFGPEGLRAGWSIILFVAIFVTLEHCVRPVFQYLLHTQPIKDGLLSTRQTVSLELPSIVALIVSMVLMAFVERRRLNSYGFARAHRARFFFGGLAWGLALLSVLIFLLRLFGLLVFDPHQLTGAAALHYGLLWLLCFLLVALQEELHFRSYLQFTMTRGLRSIFRWFFGERHSNTLGFWTAAFALSSYFGIGHNGNAGESPIGLFSAAIAGLLFCLSLWRTGSLWWAIGFHTSWDWAQSFLYGVPDSGLMARGHLFATHAVGSPWLSGGVTGPEGSILFLPVALIGAGGILLTLPRTHNGYLPLRSEDSSQDRVSILP